MLSATRKGGLYGVWLLRRLERSGIVVGEQFWSLNLFSTTMLSCRLLEKCIRLEGYSAINVRAALLVFDLSGTIRLTNSRQCLDPLAV